MAPATVTPQDLSDIASSVEGVTRLYAPRSIAATSADLGLPVAGEPTARVVVDDDGIRLRVGIDHTRTARDIAGDIHRALTRALAGTPHAHAPITVEISTIR